MTNRFTNRSSQDELLDSPNVPTRLLLQNLRELDFLNRKTGGHAISLEGIKSLLNDKNKVYQIVDLGCGSGDLLRYTAIWARKNGFKVKLTGVDKNKDAIQYLERESSNFPEIKGLTGDYREFLKHSPVDVFHCALFCHHLNNEELVELLGQMNALTSVGFVINDLKRSRMAYYGAKAFTFLFRGSTLSKHDGPVSVLRGFTKRELNLLFKQAGVNQYRILSRPFFRFLIVGKNFDLT
jgi:SAM-dependent methyltransferase